MISFQYWPRYVARVLRINAIYRGDFMSWKIDAQFKEKPTAKDFEVLLIINYN